MGKNEIFFITKVILIVFGLLGLIVFGVYLMEKYISCPRFGKEVQLPVKYDFWAGGCFVLSPEGKWVPSKNYVGITK